MVSEQRTQYGFPVIDRAEQARIYAAEARERNKPKCDCDACRRIELEPAIVQLVRNWPTP